MTCATSSNKSNGQSGAEPPPLLIQTKPSQTNMNRDQLQESYIESIIDGMDHKSMYQYVYDNLTDHFDKYSEQELITEVEDYNPELLD